jgi:kynurenine 3-monooxygenase
MNLSPDFAYTWSSKNTVVASFPNKDKSVTALLIYPLEKRPTFRVFKKLFPSLSSIEKEFELAQDASEGRFVTLHSTNWVFRDFMLILGDAAHGFNPFFGQGISAGMGDVQRLLEVIDSSENPERALSRYVDSRKLQMDALGELSKEGFERYRRDKIADFDVIYDKIESILHQYLPKYFAPSIFESISQDPGLAHTYLQKRISQRNLLNMLGMSVIVKLIIALLEVKQNVSHVKLPVILPLGKNTMKIS